MQKEKENTGEKWAEDYITLVLKPISYHKKS